MHPQDRTRLVRSEADTPEELTVSYRPYPAARTAVGASPERPFVSPPATSAWDDNRTVILDPKAGAEKRRLWRYQVRSDGMGAEAIASWPFAFIPRNFLSDGLVRARAAPFIGVRTEGNTMLTQNTGRRTAQALALTLALGLGASGAAYAKNPMVGGAPMYAQKTIVENAVNSKDHTTLVAAVKAAGLVDTLNGPGPFTVFAPTNAAFAKLPPGTVESLVQPQNKATLTKILTYHVVPGVYTAKDLMALAKKGGGQGVLTTVEGEPLAVEVQGKKVLVTDQKGNTATVTIPNVMQSNGVIHVINAVLMP